MGEPGPYNRNAPFVNYIQSAGPLTAEQLRNALDVANQQEPYQQLLTYQQLLEQRGQQPIQNQMQLPVQEQPPQSQYPIIRHPVHHTIQQTGQPPELQDNQQFHTSDTFTPVCRTDEERRLIFEQLDRQAEFQRKLAAGEFDQSVFDVHKCDGNLKYLSDIIQYDLSKLGPINDAQKIYLFNWWRHIGLTPEAINYVNVIIRDVGQAPNFDGSNGIWADHLLLIMAARIPVTGGLSMDDVIMFSEQLADIHGGPCPPGRVDRLLQIYVPLRERLWPV